MGEGICVSIGLPETGIQTTILNELFVADLFIVW
jgi:hypothetical protein